ncbi:hypothetical protein QN391_22705 [Pseudomonas sp. CCI1.2]|uniref:DUF6957 family protein n=1 Tax=Pseudomonas sp. CCI1.2 TaxID=3048614 RepID=UPI002B2233CB|nr:hypothetical protein [Pseudomonas sp. CCI1.2]MEB0123472.1 hypothetical protein [Pseudomonas sp. CCI1.2]
MSDSLNAVAEFLHGNGEPLLGFEGDDAQAEAEAILNCSGRQYCVVREWIIAHVEVPDDYRASLSADGLEPNVIYAFNVVLHSAGKRRGGDWVRSTFQRSNSEVHLFKTKNTTYVLLGPGVRKNVSAKTILAILE